MSRIKKFEEVRKWAKDRGLYEWGDPATQAIKMMEELGEYSSALLKRDKAGMVDALGDMQVVLINMAKLSGVNLEDCLDVAYEEIKDRKGRMENGTFIKDN